MTITNNKIFGYSFTSVKVDNTKDRYLVLPVLYSIFLFIYSQWEALNHLYVVNDDMAQHLVWLHQYTGHHFIPGDPLIQTSAALQPWGYWLLCRLAGLFFEPVDISRFFPLLPLMLTATYTFRLIKLRYDVVLAMAGVILMCNYPFERMVGFNARAFGYPLLMAFLYYFARREIFRTCVVLVISALFYPVITLVGSGILIFGMACRTAAGGRSALLAKSNLPPLFSIGISAVLIAVQAYRIRQSPLLGQQFAQSELLSLPEFSEWGRVDFVSQSGWTLWQNFQWGHFLKLPYLEYLVWLLLVVLVVQLVTQRKFREFDQGLIGLLVAGTGLAGLAQVLLPQLFFPERFIYYTFVPFLYLLIIRILGIFHRVFAYLIPMILLLSLLFFEGFTLRSPYAIGLRDYRKYAGVYETISTLPSQSMIAGPLAEMSHVPVFAQQSVLVSEEAAHAIYFRNQHKIIMPRVEDLLRAYTSRDLEEVKRFVEKYQIDYLLIKKSFFNTNDMYVFRPFIGWMRQRVTGFSPQDYALINVPPQWVLDIDEEYALIECRGLTTP